MKALQRLDAKKASKPLTPCCRFFGGQWGSLEFLTLERTGEKGAVGEGAGVRIGELSFLEATKPLTQSLEIDGSKRV